MADFTRSVEAQQQHVVRPRFEEGSVAFDRSHQLETGLDADVVQDLDFAALLADKAFDSDGLRTELDNRGAVAVIPPKANRVTTIPCDFEMYKWRHLVENFFCQIKEFRRIATRYDKTDTSFAAMIQLVGSVLATR